MYTYKEREREKEREIQKEFIQIVIQTNQIYLLLRLLMFLYIVNTSR